MSRFTSPLVVSLRWLVAPSLLLLLFAACATAQLGSGSTVIQVGLTTKVSGDPFFNVGYPDSFTLNGLHAATLNMTEGVSYTFIVSVPAIHPFYIGTSSVGQDAGFLAGGVTSGNLSFTPSSSSPSTLYYQCENHANMGNAITVLPALPAASSSSSSASVPPVGSSSSGSTGASASVASSASTSSSALLSSVTSPLSSSSSSLLSTGPLPDTGSSSGGSTTSTAATVASSSSASVASSVSSVASASTGSASASTSSSSSPTSAGQSTASGNSGSGSSATSTVAAASSSSSSPTALSSTGIESSGSSGGSAGTVDALLYTVSVVPKVAGDPFFNVGYPDEYTLNGLHAPQLVMTQGVSYTFIVSVPAIHPFYIGTSSVGQDAGFLAGGVTSGNLSFTPSSSSPSTLYYQCENHANMGNAITVLPASAPTGATPALSSTAQSGGQGVGSGAVTSASASSFVTLLIIIACSAAALLLLAM